MNALVNGNGKGIAHEIVIPSPVPPAPPDGPVHEILGVLARRWRLILATVVVAMSAAALYSLVATRWFEGRATVLIEARSPHLAIGEGVAQDEATFNNAKYDYYLTQFALLTTPALIDEVIAELHLGDDPRFLPAGTAPGELPPWSLNLKYLKQLSIEPVRGTRLVTIVFSSPDAELAAAVANAHARVFVRRSLQHMNQAGEQMRTFLQAKLGELRENMESAEARLDHYQSEHGLLPRELTQGVSQERFTDLSRRITAAQADRIALEAERRLAKKGDLDSLPTVVESPLIQRLRGDLDRMTLDYALMAQRFRPTYPPLQQLGGQLASAREQLRAEMGKVAFGVETRWTASRRVVQDLRRQLAAERAALLEERGTEAEHIRLTTEAETTRALHDNVLARIKELDVTAAADTSNISVIEAATVPGIPSWPALTINLLLSLVAGLLVGSGLAFLRDSLQATVRDSNDLCRVTGLETLAVIPDFDAAPRARPDHLRGYVTRAARGLRRIAPPPMRRRNGSDAPRWLGTTYGESAGPEMEGYRTLRTAIVLNRASTDVRVMLVSSAAAREGKTTTAVNVALMLAGCGANVLLVDGDLRLPRCHHALGATPEPGLRDFLSGSVVAPPIQATAHPHLSFLGAGRGGADPTELLASAWLARFAEDARARFDYVVIDSPPVLAVSDGLLLASVADGVVLVAERERSGLERVHLAVERFQRAGAVLLGAVLNRGELEAEYYRYGYARPVPGGNGRPATATAGLA